LYFKVRDRAVFRHAPAEWRISAGFCRMRVGDGS
jgi:hypothetical protein